MRHRYLAAAAVAVTLAAACADDPTGGGLPVENQVAVRDNSFSPASLSVAQGTTVTWVWQGTQQHNVTWNESNPPNSPTQSSGSYTRTFNVPTGAYTYFCTIHAGMNGSITVQ